MSNAQIASMNARADQIDLLNWKPPEPRGETFMPDRDGARLSKQCKSVFIFMLSGEWRTLADISEHCSAPEASCSARLRDLRAAGYMVERKYIRRGLHHYRLLRVDMRSVTP